MRKVLVWTLILMCLAGAVPSAAQEDAPRVRFANLVVDASSLTFTGMSAETLADVGPYGTVSDDVEVPTDMTGIGYNLQVGGSSQSGMHAGMDPIFVPGHEYLVMVIGGSTGDDLEYDLMTIDLTGQFGTASTTAGQGRLLVLYNVAEVLTSAYTLEADLGKITTFLAIDPDSFDSEEASSAIALTPGDYQLTMTDATNPETVLVPPTTVTLQPDQTAILIVFGTTLQDAHTYLFAGDALQILGQ